MNGDMILNRRTLQFHEFGEPVEVLALEHRQLSRPEAGEVFVRMLAAPINPSDLIPIRGAYAHRISLPAIPGYEGVGVIEDVGVGVPSSWIGKRVLPLRGEGTWQEVVKTKIESVVPVPHEIDDETASQLYINPVTAWLICTKGLRLRPDDILLVNACGSAIGRIFAQLSKVFGFRLIAVVRNSVHANDLIALGAWRVINTSEEPLFQRVMELSKGIGASAGIDSIGGNDAMELVRCTRSGGTVLSIGLLSGQPPRWEEVAKSRGVTVRPFWLRTWVNAVNVEIWQETFAEVMQLVTDVRLRFAPVWSRYDMADVNQAIATSEKSGRTGKVLLSFDE